MDVTLLPTFVNVNTKIPGSIQDLFTITRSGIPIIGWLLFALGFDAGGIVIVIASVFTDILAPEVIDVSLYFFATGIAFFLYALVPGILLTIMLYGGIAVLLVVVGYAAVQLLS